VVFMPTAVADDLKSGDKSVERIAFYTFLLYFVALIGLIFIFSFFIYLNKDNPRIQEGILGLVGALMGGGAGGYLGAKSKIQV